MQQLGYLDMAVVHVDPVQDAGEEHHRILAYSHDFTRVRSRLVFSDTPPAGSRHISV